MQHLRPEEGLPGSDEIRDAGTCCCREGSTGSGVVLDRAADVGLEHPSLIRACVLVTEAGVEFTHWE